MSVAIALIRAPERIRLSRAKGWRMPANTVKIDRSTRWGNPYNETQSYVCFTHRGLPAPLVQLLALPSLDRCIDLYVAHLAALLSLQPDFLEPLRGKNVGCWCELHEPCHGDVLLRLANFR